MVLQALNMTTSQRTKVFDDMSGAMNEDLRRISSSLGTVEVKGKGRRTVMKLIDGCDIRQEDAGVRMPRQEI